MPQTFKSCTRLLSDRRRNKKWKLPPAVSNFPSSSQSKVTTKMPISQSRGRSASVMVLSGSRLRSSSTWRPKNSAREESVLEDWATRKIALKRKFPEGWQPTRKLSPDAMEGIRTLQRQVNDQRPLVMMNYRDRNLQYFS
jgi:hypothetical protein